MRTMDHVKKRIITSVVAILLLIITLFGITYAYFISRVQGNTNDSISVSAGKLALKYGDGNGDITVEKIIPGTVIEEKTFTVTNTGTHVVESYEVIVENVYNDLDYYEDLTYELTCKSYKTTDYEANGDNATETGTCNGNSGIFPKSDDYLVRNSIDKDMTHAYVLTLTYNETNEDQSIDMKKTITARVNIIDDEMNYKSVLVYGNSIQDGIPSPTSPVEIESVGNLITDESDANYGKYALPITVSSKNLFDMALYTKSVSGNGITVTYLPEEDAILLNGTATATTPYQIPSYLNIPITKGESFSLSSRYVSGTVTRVNDTDYALGYFGANDNINSSTNWQTVNLQEYDVTKNNVACNYNYITKFWFYISSGVTFDDYKVKIQIERNSTATTYEPYSSEKYNIILNEPLRKVGDCDTCADYIDLYNKKVYRNVDRYDFSEHKAVDYYSSRITSSTWNTCVVALEFDNKKLGYETSLCNYFQRVDNANAFTASSATNGIYSDHPNYSRIYINIGDSATLYSSSNPISNWENYDSAYCIAGVKESLEPEIIDIDIPKIDKDSIITVGTTVQPSKIETEY